MKLECGTRSTARALWKSRLDTSWCALNSIGQDGQGLVATIGTNVEYAPYVELGTSNAPAQAFLLPALEAGQ